MTEQFDLFGSRVARDKGVNRVAQHNLAWRRACTEIVLGVATGTEMTGEMIRRRCRALGFYPTHHNAWGALVMHLIRQGALTETGRHVQMKDKRSHARKTPVYRRN